MKTPGAQFWFVGAYYGDKGDQTERFIAQGIWENGYEDRYLDLVRQMRPGDRIAIKAAYTRKHDLPFDTRGHTVSVMAIKAVGTIIENLNDGRRVRIEWTKIAPPREWYFYTNMTTVWRVAPGKWTADALIAFVFDGTQQDIERFCNAPQWRERFGTKAKEVADRFPWTRFYEAVADGLLSHRDNRQRLVAFIEDLSKRSGAVGHLGGDHYADGGTGFVRDICPFTVMGLFNRNTTIGNRRAIAQELASFLGVTDTIPATFDGVPVLNNLGSWLFPHEATREPDHIDALWRVFADGIALVDGENEAKRSAFIAAFDDAIRRPQVSWKLTMGLYWSRPWGLVTLDSNTRSFIADRLRMPLRTTTSGGILNGSEYLGLIERLRSRFEEDAFPVHSIPELSLEAWRFSSDKVETDFEEDSGGQNGDPVEEEAPPALPQPLPPLYAVQDILTDGCFLDLAEIEGLRARLRDKKNLILQGPPGTGKTWLAKRLAFALIGARDENKVRVVQFHPNMSYEDFVRGWRPSGEGKLALVDGVFMEAIAAALRDPDSPYVVVIEEINRGNPAQIFGELLTLLEASKRTPQDAVELCYPDADGKKRPLHIPENVFVIGTMNIADRSLALVDLALRRRFAFATLDPRLGERWRNWVVQERGMDLERAKDMEARIEKLNERITSDQRLGKQFRVGHSFVTPSYPLEPGTTTAWFQQVATTEILPLLEEYWFDAPGEAASAFETLMQGW